MHETSSTLDMNSENKEQNLETFSAYWHVEGNPKQTAKAGHIKHAQEKNLDYFICPQNQIGNFDNRIDLEFDDLPSLPYIKNLTNFCKSKDTVFAKFNLKITSEAFLKLVTIWTSKVLFFQKILDYTDADYLMWIDCVHSKDQQRIASIDSDRCCSTKYHCSQLNGRIFGGLIENTLPSTKILAQVIKLPRYLVTQFIEKYIECLQFVDNNFDIYDEEIVLTIMLSKYPDLFHS